MIIAVIMDVNVPIAAISASTISMSENCTATGYASMISWAVLPCILMSPKCC